MIVVQRFSADGGFTVLCSGCHESRECTKVRNENGSVIAYFCRPCCNELAIKLMELELG